MIFRGRFLIVRGRFLIICGRFLIILGRFTYLLMRVLANHSREGGLLGLTQCVVGRVDH